MNTLRIVLLSNDKYLVQWKYWFCPWTCCEAERKYGVTEHGRTWGKINSKYAMKYCAVDTEKEAEVTLAKTIEALKKNNIKVVRVIKKVKL